MEFWEHMASNLTYVIPYVLLYLVGIVVAAINIRRLGTPAWIVVGACSILLVSIFASQIIQAYFYSTEQWTSIAWKVWGYFRMLVDLVATAAIIFAVFAGRAAGPGKTPG